MIDAVAGYRPEHAECDVAQDDLILPFADLLGDLSGKRVLEYGCGDGKLSVVLAKRGAHVSAFDLSRSSVELTRRRAEANRVRIEAVEAAAERLPYADSTFDLVVGRAVLHLLDVDRARDELQRILKRGGRAVFSEPLPFVSLRAWEQGFCEFGYREIGLPTTFNRIPFLRRYHRRALVAMVK